jgi:nicotinate-nucleotide adenylyltransferase
MDLDQCSTIVVFGGSFDPPHIAHLRLPIEAMVSINADAVTYIPAARQPLKADRLATSAEHRLAMLQLALADQPHGHILTDELDRASDGRPSYTVDTLEALSQKLGSDVRLRLLIGADQLRQFDRWHQWQRIIELAEPLVMLRPPDTSDTLLDAMPQSFDCQLWRQRIVALPALDVSSTMIRNQVAAGESIAGLVCPAVEQYILEHGLYRPN